MAVLGKNGRKSSGFGWLLFWLAFLIGVTFLFVLYRHKIQDSLAVLGSLLNGTEAPGETGIPETDGLPEAGNPDTNGDGPLDGTGLPETGVSSGAEAGNPGTDVPGDAPPALTEGGTGPDGGNSSGAPFPETVKRQVYLIRLDNTGNLLAVKAERKLPSSSSPLHDAIASIIAGPSPEESKRNLLSLIPGNVKILGAVVRGSTAYLNFSEDFLFNTYGIEGYAGQLRQIVWTATEFSNVKDVQILIDGKRIDYLGEGIWIGSPLSRNSL